MDERSRRHKRSEMGDALRYWQQLLLYVEGRDEQAQYSVGYLLARTMEPLLASSQQTVLDSSLALAHLDPGKDCPLAHLHQRIVDASSLDVEAINQATAQITAIHPLTQYF